VSGFGSRCRESSWEARLSVATKLGPPASSANQLCPSGKSASRNQKSCQVLGQKIFLFHFSEIHDCLRPSRLHRRGVSRSSRTLEVGCGGREDVSARGSAPTKASSRTVKPYGPVPPTLGSSFAGRFATRRWLKSPVHRGEYGAAVNTIAQGMSVVPAEPVVACVRKVHSLCTQGSRVRPASGIPCALSLFEGPRTMHHSGMSCRGNAETWPLRC